LATTTAPASRAAARYDYKIPFVIGASAIGTVIEWYDFYLYGVLAAFFSTQFFPAADATAALLASLATFGAGFAVRPFGAAVFGRIGDIVGRKFTFLVTITVMGLSTAAVGVLPTYTQIGLLAPVFLVTLRLAQGLALGGEDGVKQVLRSLLADFDLTLALSGYTKPSDVGQQALRRTESL